MKRKIGVVAVAGCAVLLSAAPAQAASWNAFPGMDSRWTCGPTVTIRQGLQAQSCVVVSGSSYQGATIVNVPGGGMINGETRSWEAGKERPAAGFCDGPLAGQGVCFNETRPRLASGNAVQTVSSVSDGNYSKRWTSPTVVVR